MIDIKAMQKDFLARKAALDSMPIEERIRNEETHVYGIVDDRYGCVECDATPYSFWKYPCR